VTTLGGSNNTYSGGTTVSGGTLLITGYYGASNGKIFASPTGLGGVTVYGGRLGGTGQIGNGSNLPAGTGGNYATVTGSGGVVSINSGGIVSPGTSTLTDSSVNGVGTLTTGDMTWNGGQYTFKTNVSTGQYTDVNDLFGSTSQDLLIVDGILNIAAGTTGSPTPFRILIASASSSVQPSSSAVYTIAYANAVDITANGVTTPVAAGTTLPAADFSISDDSSSGNSYNVVVANDTVNGAGYDIEVVASPEPGSLGLLGVGCLGLLRRRRIVKNG
jgi:autotransporter-associated beta strand protein